MKLRLFQDRDAADVSALIIRCLREVNSRDYSPDIITAMCAHFSPATILQLAGQRQMWVAEADGLTVGTVSRDQNKVYTMFVSPDYAGRGIGRRLLEHIERRAAAAGYDFMETGASITAHDFYRKRGYADARETETEAGLNYIMRKQLLP
jgi:GNAT superfamily N-acetyltransferase